MLVSNILQFLAIARPLDCDRMEFFIYAEAFAALVKLEIVLVTGAITTITVLLRKPETRAAAITMLGKTVELCINLLHDKCDPLALQELWGVLSTVRFSYH